MIDLKICQVCMSKPAIYGDGVTWSRCSDCQYKHNKDNNIADEKPAPIESEVFEHKTIPGKVSIIMPLYVNNYSLFHYTGNAIGSIREHTKGIDYELIVIDNGSPLKPPNLQSYYADKIIVNEENIGVTKSWNQGIRMSSGEYVVLINNDTQVFDGWMEDILESLKSLDLVMSYPMYSLTEPFARAVESAAIRKLFLDKPIEESFSDFTDFACVGFKKSLVDEIGLFNENFFNYASDVEFRDRMKQFGKKFASCKRIAIHHISDATGYSIPETPEIMNKDKEIYEVMKTGVQVAPIQSNEPKKQEETPVSLTKVERLIRSDYSGDRIYFIHGDKTHWIKNPETLKALGFDFGQEVTIPKEEFVKYERGEDINMENVDQYKNA